MRETPAGGDAAEPALRWLGPGPADPELLFGPAMRNAPVFSRN
jgi:hypothetical protein